MLEFEICLDFGAWNLVLIILECSICPSLFDPLRIKGLELRNRIVFAPVVTNFGLRNERAINFFAARAKGGAGLIIVHGTPVDLLIKADWARSLKNPGFGRARTGGEDRPPALARK